MLLALISWQNMYMQSIENLASNVIGRYASMPNIYASGVTSACLLYHPDTKIACDGIKSIYNPPVATSEYFKEHEQFVPGGLAAKYLDAMALQYVELRQNTYI